VEKEEREIDVEQMVRPEDEKEEKA